ncbi:transmembrane protein 39A-like [Ornithodoros turicata]|uniref:transmembrane protein 39A-like n=1 Tax=Ornithodoros turicata TaxID=34597 RepID=UPI00313A2093
MTRVSGVRRNAGKSSKSSPDERLPYVSSSAPSSAMPKHIPLPEIPADGELAFELLSLLFCLVLHGSLYLNLYRTVWWLPHSHNDHALNYYLMDRHVIMFSALVMNRRFPITLLKSVLWYTLPYRWYQVSVSASRTSVLVVVVLALLWCTYNICLRHGMFSVFALAYPAVIYMALFGPVLGPVTELLPRWTGRITHGCSSSPVEVRAEVDALRWDFNERLKRALFCALGTAYYSTFLPCCFLQSELYFDLQWAVQHGIFAWCSALTLHASYCFPPRYLDMLHRAALHLGRWRRLEARNVHAPHHIWADNVIWPQNNLVKHNKEYFRAEGISNAAEPGCGVHSRFYTLFFNPMLILTALLGLDVFQVAFQLYALVRSTEWNHLFMFLCMIMLNSVTLFKLMRQYLVMDRVYHYERVLQEKLGG